MPSWDEEFSKPGYRYGTVPNGFLVEMAERLPKGCRVIAAGDGEGRNGVWLASQGHRVLALDASPVGLAKARALAGERGVSLETAVADLSTYAPEAASADAVVLIYVHMPPAVRRVAHRNLTRALKPGGLIILEAFHRDQLGRSSGGRRGTLPCCSTSRFSPRISDPTSTPSIDLKARSISTRGAAMSVGAQSSASSAPRSSFPPAA